MSKVEKLIQEKIRSLGGYEPGKPLKQAERESGIRCIKMASNENPFGPSPRAVEAMRQAIGEVNIYPDNDACELRDLIAAQNNMKPGQVLITSGSTSFLDIIARTVLGPGLNAITCERSFIVYPVVTKTAGGELIRVPLRDNIFDLDGILAAINENTRLVFIANPNNPTGTVVDAKAIDRFLDKVPDHVLVVLDEAYHEFAQYFAKQSGTEYTHSLNYVREGRNVVVLRTFSKAQGLAAVRVGYGFAPEELIQYFARVRIAFSITGVGEAGAIAALGDEEHTRRTIENNAKGAAWLTEKLKAMGLHPVQTWANFIYIEVDEDAKPLAKRLQDNGIIIRPLTGWGAPKAIRVTVGNPEQNQKFIEVLSKVLEPATV